jgi:murein DD-endopeptidase MepM/ murein hydrolase activator NlpD
MRQLQPPAIRVLDPDPNQLLIAHRTAPNALILPRDWALSEQHDDVRRDPVGTGKRHAQDWRQKLDRWALPIPANQIVVVGMNELQVWNMLPQAVEYTVAMLDECTRLGLRACALNLSVGWPANTGPDTPPDWKPYAPIEASIKRGDHILTLHSYWYRSGPKDGAGWWAWRHRACPWDVPIIIGECGVDMYVDMKRWENDGKPNRGWQGNISPEQYAEQMEEYARGCDRRVIAILPFLTDYRSNTWQNFDTAPAHNALLARKDRMVPQASAPTGHVVHLPSVGTGPTPATPAAVPQLTHPIADASKRIISQRWGENGHRGIDYAVVTGTPIGAVDAGTVVESQFDEGGYGEYVKLRHQWGESLYAHLKTRKVGAGEVVNRGMVVGHSGNTGNSTGSHLHFAIRINPYNRADGKDGFSDPSPYLQGAAQPAPQPTDGDLLVLIKAAAKEFGIDAKLLGSLVYAESRFDAKAVSSAKAMGLAQITPPTWAEWSAKVGVSDPFDPVSNLRVGAAYLRWCLDQTGGDRLKALVAYNWGLGNLRSGAETPLETRIYAYSVVHGADFLKAWEGLT